METLLITPSHEHYPSTLISLLGPQAPSQLQMQGNTNLLSAPKLSLFCSSHCPGSILNKAYDLANGLRQNLITVMGGFHAPMEREWLQILMSSATAIIRCPARELISRRLTAEDKRLLGQDRLLLLSFISGVKRPTKDSAFFRNICIAALAEKIFVAYAGRLSKTEGLCRQLLQWGKTVYTFDDEHTASLTEMGAIGVTNKDFLALLNS
ncbi:DNA-processing protein DprA [candidate division KSB1 bacterium]|nr:DNA-processing protein DprA [candidate division KSB1 bacterium]